MLSRDTYHRPKRLVKAPPPYCSARAGRDWPPFKSGRITSGRERLLLAIVALLLAFVYGDDLSAPCANKVSHPPGDLQLDQKELRGFGRVDGS